MPSPFESRPSDLAALSDEAALQRHFDATTYRWLRIWCFAFATVAVGFALWMLARGSYLRLALPLFSLILLRWVFWAMDRPAFVSHFRHFALLSLLAQFVLAALYLPELGIGLYVLGFLAPVVLTPLRLGTLTALPAYVFCLIASLNIANAWSNTTPLSVPLLSLLGTVTLAGLFLNLGLMRADSSKFRGEFQVEASRHRDRVRMRDELDYARRIQLRMLPQGDPTIEGFDIASISLPATEVGGDYYEYFRSADSPLTIAIGDVAGHGVASGLLLSGIRSCLHLLQDECLAPRETMERLNRMVRQTTDSRMFITLLYIVFDRDRRSIRVAVAGHPPLLHLSPAASSCEVGHPAPPLGTRLEANYREQEACFSTGDVMVLYTDGLTEVTNHREEMYGWERLTERVRENTHKPSRDIREAVLADLWNFKGDAEQLDDITLVVVKAE